jgi:hypothetical protein
MHWQALAESSYCRVRRTVRVAAPSRRRERSSLWTVPTGAQPGRIYIAVSAGGSEGGWNVQMPIESE